MLYRLLVLTEIAALIYVLVGMTNNPDLSPPGVLLNVIVLSSWWVPLWIVLYVIRKRRARQRLADRG